jgi:hypothetical protein
LTPRKTPIGYLHRLVRYKLPALLWTLDQRLTYGTLAPLLLRCGNYLLNEKHPLVMVFYLTLVTGGIYMFLISGWSILSTFSRLLVLLVVPLPYISLYLAAASDPGIITPQNHKAALKIYPYDCLNFFPPPTTAPCRTCHLQKPARSKHCSICKACIAKHDHHCIWINNCVGLNNTRHFLAFLLSTDLLLAVGTILSYGILNTMFERNGIDTSGLLGGWREWAAFIGVAVLEEVYVGAVFLLCILCGILSFTFTTYHLYLVWAGTTTNETTKWADWRDDIKDGIIFKTEADSDAEVEERDGEDEVEWPRKPRQSLYRVESGNTGDLPHGLLWFRVQSLTEVDNMYDLGGWNNFLDVVFPKKLG